MFSDFHLAIQLHEKVDWLGFYFPLLHSPQFSPIFLAPIFSSFYAFFFGCLCATCFIGCIRIEFNWTRDLLGAITEETVGHLTTLAKMDGGWHWLLWGQVLNSGENVWGGKRKWLGFQLRGSNNSICQGKGISYIHNPVRTEYNILLKYLRTIRREIFFVLLSYKIAVTITFTTEHLTIRLTLLASHESYIKLLWGFRKHSTDISVPHSIEFPFGIR